MILLIFHSTLSSLGLKIQSHELAWPISKPTSQAVRLGLVNYRHIFRSDRALSSTVTNHVQ